MLSAEERWGASGLAWLTGESGAAPDFSRCGIMVESDRIADSIEARLGVAVDPVAELTGRAAIAGLARRGRISAGGSTRLMRYSDGWFALTLSREDDVAAVPALVGDDSDADPWQRVEQWASTRAVAEVVERCALLDLPFGVLGEASVGAVSRRDLWPRRDARGIDGLLVADLTSMWAGPLCGRILADAGATVVKVENRSRPDGTRFGDSAVFDMVNRGKLSYAVDLDRDDDAVRRLLGTADIVLEGSRPRALKRRRLDADSLPPRAGRIWLRISGHGPGSDRTAFGDDAAVAGGLVGRAPSGPVFCGDAIADPLTGLESALAVGESLASGGGHLIDVAMAGVAARYAAVPLHPSSAGCEVVPPARPAPSPPGPALGADNDHVENLVLQRFAC